MQVTGGAAAEGAASGALDGSLRQEAVKCQPFAEQWAWGHVAL